VAGPHGGKSVAALPIPFRTAKSVQNPKAARIYDKLIQKYAACEREMLAELGCGIE